ncbi:MAG: hypothetical protein MRZ73_04590 [Pseudoflavonifractor capillosus]|uniref:hypothetical protein n=1 Tax=Eubacteriales TaxID=186802 RepID=UPI0023FA3D29|nr:MULTISPECIES: hypothetical protein [Eubacteriales]MCI5927804.1 hypothetical protein [Pseudoflavonifractor capillosus]MDY3014407.1 hypothetical protein [Evtepia sp.]MDY4661788.1 hypothetical protein [Pseudoflavonifractor capillosus]
MKKSALLGLALALTLLPAGCGQDAAAPSAEIPSFSYAEVQDTYEENTPGVLRDGFQNTSPLAIGSAEEAAQRATAECTISYDSVTCSYDSEADIWNVSFFTSGGVGGCQDVYLNSSGITYLIVYGE